MRMAILCMLLALCSCKKTNEDKAVAGFKEYLEPTMADPESFELVKVDTVKVLMQADTISRRIDFQYKKLLALNDAVLTSYKRYSNEQFKLINASLSGHNLSPYQALVTLRQKQYRRDSVNYAREDQITDDLYALGVSPAAKDNQVGYQSVITYRQQGPGGGKEIQSRMVAFDKNFKVLYLDSIKQ